MMNLKHLSDQVLLLKIKELVSTEREILIKVLYHLKEIETRRLHSVLKFPSLFEYAVRELRYSESQALRRISAMRLLKELPEIEGKIVSGALTLSNMAMAQSLFSKEKVAGRIYDSEKKTEVLVKLENQSSRNAQKIIFAISPEMKPKSLDFNSIEDESLRAKLLRIKGLLAHENPHLTLNDLLHKLCDTELKRREKSPSTSKVDSDTEVRRQVWRRDYSQCTNCGSGYALEIDHIRPRAVGGLSTLQNMRLLCRSCNQRAAIDYFGPKKMALYLKASVSTYKC